MITVSVPVGVDAKAVTASLLKDYNIEIGNGLGELAGKVWRIGLMGYASNRRNVLRCLGALEAVLADQGVSVESGRAVSAAQGIYGA